MRDASPAPLPFNRSRRLSDIRTGEYAIARQLDDVLDAWKVLYTAYLRAGFIRPNPYLIHTAPQAVGDHALVLLRRSDDTVTSTITAIGDSPAGLPLDAVFRDDLDALRNDGAKLIEIGLFGDRRDATSGADRSFSSVFELMRYTFFFALHTGVTDFLCGIPPRRAPLYARCFGFRCVSDVRSYASVEDNPVVLMRARTEHLLAHPDRYRAVSYFLNNPLPPAEFEGRFRFGAQAIRGSRLEGYLAARAQPAPAVDQAALIA